MDLSSRRHVTAGLVLTAGLALGASCNRREARQRAAGPTGDDRRVIDVGEWSDAAVVDTTAGRLHVKEAGEFVFVGIELPASAGFVDLFITADGGPLYDLHASARLGERALAGRVWPDWRWWNNTGWVANVSRVESFDQRTFLPEHAREFQIRRTRFAGRR